MIVQQVNLFQDRFREKTIPFSTAQVASLLLVLAFGLSIWSLTIYYQGDEARDFNRVLIQRQLETANQLSTASAELKKLLSDTRIDQSIDGVSSEIAARRQVLNFVESNQFGSGSGFSSYLVSLSKLQANNLWLDRINLTENYIGIKGSALNAESIPIYFDRFSGEPVFQGNRFDIFRLERDQSNDWKVDFEIATRAVPNE